MRMINKNQEGRDKKWISSNFEAPDSQDKESSLLE